MNEVCIVSDCALTCAGQPALLTTERMRVKVTHISNPDDVVAVLPSGDSGVHTAK